MIFILIFVALTLSVVTAFQFLYLAYLERIVSEHKKKIRELERHCRRLSAELEQAEEQIHRQTKLINSFAEREEIWADVIDADPKF